MVHARVVSQRLLQLLDGLRRWLPSPRHALPAKEVRVGEGGEWRGGGGGGGGGGRVRAHATFRYREEWLRWIGKGEGQWGRGPAGASRARARTLGQCPCTSCTCHRPCAHPWAPWVPMATLTPSYHGSLRIRPRRRSGGTGRPSAAFCPLRAPTVPSCPSHMTTPEAGGPHPSGPQELLSRLPCSVRRLQSLGTHRTRAGFWGSSACTHAAPRPSLRSVPCPETRPEQHAKWLLAQTNRPSSRLPNALGAASNFSTSKVHRTPCTHTE